MAVLRTEKTKGFTVIDNEIFRNKSLSLKAKGLLCLMLSLPDGWNYSLDGLTRLSTDGISSIRSALAELQEHGYFYRRQVREDGKIKEIEYVISEQPNDLVLENLKQENLKLENLNLEKHTQLNTNTSNKEVSNTKKSKETIADVLDMLPEELRPVAESFVEHRKALRSPMTANALRLAVKKAKKLANDDIDTTIAIMNQSIENGWKGIFPLKQESPPQQKGRNDWLYDLQRMA